MTASFVAVVVFGACSTLLGIDDRDEIPGPSGAQSGAGGTGAAGGAATTGGQGGATTGTAGTGGSTGCTANTDCATDPDGHFCDPTTHACVECLALTDCSKGQYCDTSAKVCVAGCLTAADCNISGGNLTCDVATHTCHGCATDGDCPPGLLCDAANSVCIPGCTNAHVCPAGRECCSGSCANLNTDPNNCSVCGIACKAPNATPACSAGKCTWSSCLLGFADCNGQKGDGCEVDLFHDPAHCFTCANACTVANGKPACEEAQCGITSCNTGYADCNGTYGDGCETHLATDVDNCGGCGVKCDATHGTPSCTNGSCTIACSTGFGDCDGNPANGCETNLGASVNDCGSCGNVCPTSGGTPFCSNGMCGVTVCPSGSGDCDGNGTCETTLDTLANCGACGVACAPPHAADASCASGACAFTTCAAGWGNCDGDPANGCETATTGDVNNCGSCGKVCDLPNANTQCVAGACGITTCVAGFADCNGIVGDGCETNLDTTPSACGSCNTMCAFPNASAKCVGGQCELDTCSPGYADCNGIASDGCETPLGTTANCGACGNACNTPNATPTCTGGQCAIQSCNPGYADCDNVEANGCEVDTTSNVNNCGMCGHVCPSTQGVPSCTNGVCGYSACSPGTADCDHNGTCETNTTNDPNNCNGCGLQCVVNNGTGTCVSSACEVGMCAAPFANCDGVYQTGCEANLSSDPNNCATCGHVCSSVNGTASCNNANCKIVCNAGFGDCDNNVATGCETQLGTTLNCLSCGNKCAYPNGVAQCYPMGGGCQLVGCNTNWQNCDGQISNGCELNCQLINASYASCGSPTTCAFGCNAPFQDCDGIGSNGCEANLQTDPNNCGSCKKVCPTNYLCCNGQCQAGTLTCPVSSGSSGSTGPGPI